MKHPAVIFAQTVGFPTRITPRRSARSPSSARTPRCRSGSFRTTSLRWVPSSDPSSWCCSRRGRARLLSLHRPRQGPAPAPPAALLADVLPRPSHAAAGSGRSTAGGCARLRRAGWPGGRATAAPARRRAAVSGELRERLGSYLARAGRLPGSEHRRWLAAHDCSLDSLLPSRFARCRSQPPQHARSPRSTAPSSTSAFGRRSLGRLSRRPTWRLSLNSADYVESVLPIQIGAVAEVEAEAGPRQGRQLPRRQAGQERLIWPVSRVIPSARAAVSAAAARPT